MPIFEKTVAGATQFDGLTVDTGLFEPSRIGSFRQQIRINSIEFKTSGTTTQFVLSRFDPESPTDARGVLLASTAAMDSFAFGPTLLPTRKDFPTSSTNTAFGVRLVTTGKTADGTLTIDFDSMLTEQ